MYDFLIVGAGLFGSVAAHEAKAAGKSVLVVEKRPHIGGNAYTESRAGIQVHRYGPHIFHTNSREVWEYIAQFADFLPYIHSPVADYRGERYSLPFSMHTFRQMWGVTKPEEAEEILARQRKEIAGIPKNLEEQAVCLVGRDVFEKLVKGYTEKQWGRDCRALPPFLIRRLPVRLTWDNHYFDARYQGIPAEGYTRLVEKLLEGVKVRLDTDYLAHKTELDALAKQVIYTGPIDAYFGYALGPLEYRTVRFETEEWDIPDFQGTAVVNYTDRETPWTRIIEHKWFAGGKEIPHTVISREYSEEWMPGKEPFYPVNDERNGRLYEKYKALADREEKVSFCGRLGEYRYYDMDQVIAAALELCGRLL